MTACRACRRPLHFIQTKNGKKMPCEADPVSPEDVKPREMVLTPAGDTFRFDPENIVHMAYEELWIPHWNNCSGGERLRK